MATVGVEGLNFLSRIVSSSSCWWY